MKRVGEGVEEWLRLQLWLLRMDPRSTSLDHQSPICAAVPSYGGREDGSGAYSHKF